MRALLLVRRPSLDEDGSSRSERSICTPNCLPGRRPRGLLAPGAAAADGGTDCSCSKGAESSEDAALCWLALRVVPDAPHIVECTAGTRVSPEGQNESCLRLRDFPVDPPQVNQNFGLEMAKQGCTLE